MGIDYANTYEWLKGLAKAHGLTVKERQFVLDYGAMNPEAAQTMGFGRGSMDIYVDPDSDIQTKCYDLGHELVEFCWMRGGQHYWQAHVKALKAEQMGPEMFPYVDKVMKESAAEGLIQKRSQELASTPRPTVTVRHRKAPTRSMGRMR